ncbi:uncharacterized protein JCM15063_003473 [Sporobolomyces koalae]|uniref:uncharacterized protein n=1 Tax=Sporobolomyces koalae TaxID=500713 RepID=UPI00316DD0D4
MVDPSPPLQRERPGPAPAARTSSSSAFSRLANLALSSSTSPVTTTGSISSSSPASTANSSSLPLSNHSSITTPIAAAPRALDALETIAYADQGRKRHGSTDSKLSELAYASSASASAGATSNRFKRSPWAAQPHPYPAYGHYQRDSSNSRSRERERERSDTGSSGWAADSPNGTGYSLRGNSYWGSESANASFGPGTSGFSTFGESHFFQPGAGSSGFSFEQSSSSLAAVGPYWDGSYRSSVLGSPSIFDRHHQQPQTQASSSNKVHPAQSSSDESRLSHLWESSSSSPSRSRARSPTTAIANHDRTASPVGGGRKLKEHSRGLRHTFSSTSREEKGLVGIAKPPRDSGEAGRVAVAGKNSLKILKVPYGPYPASTTHTAASSYAHAASSAYHVHRSSSIADRRSRSRARGVGIDGPRRDDSVDPAEEEELKRDEVVEAMDVRHGSRLSPSYLFSDVRWGYGATSSKLATACTNGAVILWDLGRDSGTKLDQVKYEHDRAVNRIVFGGQTGNWLMSGGQDGQMKLWDIRESRPSSMILKASSPVRHLSFSPSASQPFTLLAACASGTLIRYDVRYISRQNGGATDRIAGHIGSCLAMDWRDGFDCERLPGGSSGVGVSQETAGGGKEGGWVVTGGIDSTIKIWDFSLPILATKPIRTLYPSQPVQCVSWHPTTGTEIASSPLPSFSLGSTDKGDTSAPITPSATETSFLRGDGANPSGRGASSWKNEIAIWDTRRPYFPKLAIRTDEPTSSILFNDDETIWSTSKSSTTFHQHDTASDSYSLLDSIDRPTAAWNLAGDFMFVDDARTAHDIPFERSRGALPVNSEKFIPDAYCATVTDIDPDFSTEAFTHLANNLKLVGDFDEICEHNVHVSFIAGRPDAAQVWGTIKTWFGQEPFSSSEEAEATPPVGDVQVDEDRPSSPVMAAPDWILSPTSTTYSDAASRAHKGHRFSTSSMRSSPSTRRQTSGDTFDSSTTMLPKESVHQLLDTFSEESTASDTDLSTQSPYYPELSSTSSDSEHDLASRARRSHKASIASLPTNRLAASLAALADSQKKRSDVALDDLPKHASRLPSRLPSRRNSASTSSSSANTDTSDESDGEGNRDRSKPRKSSRSAKIAALHASLIANRSRRPSAGQSSERRPLRSRDSTLAGARKHSNEGTATSRRESGTRKLTGNRTMSTGLVGLKESVKSAVLPVTSKDLAQQACAIYATEAFEIVKQQLRKTLMDYADRGDSQLCAAVCCVLQDRELGLDPFWTARVTKAYLDMLRRLELHVAAATLNKYCSTDSLRLLTQDSVVFHTACGRCGKGIEQPPYDFCPKCRVIITRCGICHLAVTSLYLFCACCGHGLHEQCLQNFVGAHSSIAGPSQPQTPNTVPSTPGIATPLRAWLWGEGTSIVDSEEENGSGSPSATAEQLSMLLSHSAAGLSRPSASPSGDNITDPNTDAAPTLSEPTKLDTATPFILKLARLLRQNSPWIKWNAAGTAFFFAQHRPEFGDQLAQMFRHGNSHSFTRQLNIYDFKRLNGAELEEAVASLETDGALATTAYTGFAHPLFWRDSRDSDLVQIKPKTARKGGRRG